MINNITFETILKRMLDTFFIWKTDICKPDAEHFTATRDISHLHHVNSFLT